MPLPPPAKKSLYNQKVNGLFGKFGTGANAQIYFLQTGLKPTDLHKTTLISDIPGSECWPVRDLFQRDVDTYRVTHNIIPYFKDQDKVKFFNPLTLTLLPIDSKNNVVQTDIPNLIKSEVEEQGYTWVFYEAEGLYRIKHVKESPEYAIIEWNDSLVRIVAIDGQHRLSALKRYFNDTEKSDQHSDFLQWTIPAVIFGIDHIKDEKDYSADILHVIRNVFIYINTTAQTPNRARQILLSDESINDICTQELLNYAHSNDIKKDEERQKDRIPLLFFDWRGEQQGTQRIVSPATIKQIEEINDWLYYYILGEDFSHEQEVALGIQPISSLHKAFYNKKLTPKDSKEVAKIFEQHLLPGIAYFLENFRPYKNYITWLRNKEYEYNLNSDIARHAFYRLRFGNDRASDEIRSEVNDVYTDITEEITSEKHKNIPLLILRDIGMRGILCAFGELRNYYASSIEDTADWLEYSKWFTSIINEIYDSKWFTEYDAKKWGFHLHITHDQADTVVNYRLHDASNALGALICILVGKYGNIMYSIPNDDILNDIYNEYFDRLQSTLIRGYKKEVRPTLKEKFPEGGKPLNEAIAAEAQRRSSKHLKELEQYLEVITQSY